MNVLWSMFVFRYPGIYLALLSWYWYTFVHYIISEMLSFLVEVDLITVGYGKKFFWHVNCVFRVRFADYSIYDFGLILTTYSRTSANKLTS